MSNYVKSTNFTAKDSLPTGDANKVIRGSEFDTEFNALQVASATKANLGSPTFTGTATFDNVTVTGTADLSSASVSIDINGGTIDGTVIGGSTPAAGTFAAVAGTTGTFSGAVAGTTGTFSGAVSGTTGTFSGAVTGSNLNIANWNTAFGWGNHASAGYLTSVAFNNIDAGAVTTSSETFATSDTQLPTNAAVRSFMINTYPTIVEINDLSAAVVWTTVPDAFISASSVNQHVSVEKVTQSKTYALNETSTLTLSSSISSGVPVVSVTKEIAQSGVSNNDWNVNSTSTNYTRQNSAASTTLNFSGFDISTATFVDSFSVSSQDTVPTGVTFNNDGTKMFVTGNTGNDVNEYTLSTAYDVSTSSFVDSFSVSAQQAAPMSVAFNTDGTKMYIVGETEDTVAQYALSTGFDVSTASYTQAFSIASQETEAQGITFNTDDTKMFVVGDTGNDINEYTLSTGFDVSSASFVDSFSFASQSTQPKEAVFNTLGTELFMLARDNTAVFKYTLSTAFDVSTASYASVTFSVGSQESSPQGLAFNANGTKMFVVGDSGDAVNEYTLADATMSLGSGSFASADVGKTIEANSGVFLLTSTAGAFTQVTTPSSFNQVASGSWQMYSVVYNTTDGDLELSGANNGYLLSAAAYDSVSFSIASQESSPQGMAFNADGTKMFVLGLTGQDVNEYTLTKGFDVSTASFVDSFSVASQETDPCGLAFNTDGTKMFVCGTSGDDVNEYTLSTGFDVSTASFVDAFSVSGQTGQPRGVAFNADGTKMFIVSDATGARFVYQYTLSAGFDVSTASYASKSLNVGSQDTLPFDLAFNDNGTKLFVIGRTNDSVFQYTLSTGFDVSTASYDSVSFSVSSQDNLSAGAGLAFGAGGTKMFVVGNTSDTIYQYSTGSVLVPSGYHAAHTTTSTDSTYWTDINSMTANQAAGDGAVYYCVSTDDRTTWKVAKGTDGLRSIARNNSGTWQYNSNTTYGSETWANATTNAELPAIQQSMAQEAGFQVSNASYDSISVGVPETTSIQSLTFNADGTKMFVLDQTADDVTYYSLSVGFDLSSTVTHLGQYSVAGQETVPNGITFNPDGTKMFIVGGTGRDITYYSLSTGFDLTSTVSHLGQYSVSAQASYPREVAFNTDGTKMFVLNSTDIYCYTLSTGFDLSSTVAYVSSYSVSANMTTPIDILFNSDGTQMFLVDMGVKDVTYYSLSTGFDLSSTISYVGEFSVAAQAASPVSLAFNADGTKMFILNDDNDKVFQYSTSGLVAIAANQMSKTQLDAVPDANQFVLANDLDLAIIFNMSSGATLPSSDGVSINFDANSINQGAILGTDYSFDFPAANKVRVTSLAAQNLKVRII